MSDVEKLVAKWRTISKLYGAPDTVRDAVYQQCADELEAALASHDQKVRRETLEQAAQLVEKAFEQSWVVQDTLDAIRSLAGAGEKK